MVERPTKSSRRSRVPREIAGARPQDAPADGSCIVHGPGDGPTLDSPGGQLTYKARGGDTGGALTVFESVAAPGHGPPVHRHMDADEFLYVLEGELTFALEEAVHPAPAGTFVFIPKGATHTWQNRGDEPAQFLVFFAPAAPGMESFFERSAELPGDRRLADGFARFANDAGMEVLGPPLAATRRV